LDTFFSTDGLVVGLVLVFALIAGVGGGKHGSDNWGDPSDGGGSGFDASDGGSCDSGDGGGGDCGGGD